MIENIVRGYKVFHKNWTCRDKQYSCPGRFEEDVVPSVCHRGMHFCTEIERCFDYYAFNLENHVAEVVAYGDVDEKDGKCATNRLDILREVPWAELLGMVNKGKCCTGLHNTGDYNTGSRNTGSRNSGDDNTGDGNTGYYNDGSRNTGANNKGSHNSGGHNSGDFNSGRQNTGDGNSGNFNTGNDNSGNSNTGGGNSGDFNVGFFNSGYGNVGEFNSGTFNVGHFNSGIGNLGDYNSGSWNKADYSSGYFNTAPQRLYFFNKPSDLTEAEWRKSEAYRILMEMPTGKISEMYIAALSSYERNLYAREAAGKIKGGEKSVVNGWWKGLTDGERSAVMSMPNFDRDIFGEITGIEL